MEYWQGMMNWPIEPDAKCETCGKQFADLAAPGLVFGVALTWGLANGECRCDVCHTAYSMKSKEGAVSARPRSFVKDEYKAAARRGWALYQKPIDEWTEEQWNRAREATE